MLPYFRLHSSVQIQYVNAGIDVWNGGYYRTIETIRATDTPCFMIPS